MIIVIITITLNYLKKKSQQDAQGKNNKILYYILVY